MSFFHSRSNTTTEANGFWIRLLQHSAESLSALLLPTRRDGSYPLC
jgi:hypothetical protein